jgi:hypothetical protein
MYDFIQTALTATIEVIAFITIIGLPAHYIVMSNVREVQSWGTPQATPEAIAEESLATKKLVIKAIPAVDAALAELTSNILYHLLVDESNLNLGLLVRQIQHIT